MKNKIFGISIIIFIIILFNTLLLAENIFIESKNISLDKSFPYIMDDISSIDVDTVNDYKLVKKYFKRNHGK